MQKHILLRTAARMLHKHRVIRTKISTINARYSQYIKEANPWSQKRSVHYIIATRLRGKLSHQNKSDSTVAFSCTYRIYSILCRVYQIRLLVRPLHFSAIFVVAMYVYVYLRMVYMVYVCEAQIIRRYDTQLILIIIHTYQVLRSIYFIRTIDTYMMTIHPPTNIHTYV